MAPELTPQKPDLRLPMDVIKAASRSGGTKPLIDHVRKQQGKRHGGDEVQPEGAPAKPVSPRDRPSRPKEMISGAAPVTPAARGRRGAPGKAPGTEDPALLGGREQRQLSRRRTGAEVRPRGEDEDESRAAARRGGAPIAAEISSAHRRSGANTAAPRKSKVTLELPCTVRSFSEAIGISASQVLRQMLMSMGTPWHQHRP